MATKAFDDSRSGVSNLPPPYDPISTSVSADSVQCKRSIFSFPQSKQKRCAPVLSRIHEIVSPDFILSPVGPIINSCAAALQAPEFSNLLQKPNIKDHTALYWAIVNNRREALWEFTKFISKFSPACSSDLRLASEDKSLRCMLGCPRDEIDVLQHGSSEVNHSPDDILVHDGDGVGKSYFFARFAFRMFQKRLRIRQKLAVEFVARGRIWVLRIYMGPKGKWWLEYGLSDHSLPVPQPNAKLAIRAHSRPSYSSCVIQKPLIINIQHPQDTLVPEG
ncbi:hypothetical protein F4604DRAFT_1988707 [Suillus subluteus]|nr:hypothetical protein F4604DRAFT_1988707 [Suillus subluteus]